MMLMTVIKLAYVFHCLIRFEIGWSQGSIFLHLSLETRAVKKANTSLKLWYPCIVIHQMLCMDCSHPQLPLESMYTEPRLSKSACMTIIMSWLFRPLSHLYHNLHFTSFLCKFSTAWCNSEYCFQYHAHIQSLSRKRVLKWAHRVQKTNVEIIPKSKHCL